MWPRCLLVFSCSFCCSNGALLLRASKIEEGRPGEEGRRKRRARWNLSRLLGTRSKEREWRTGGGREKERERERFFFFRRSVALHFSIFSRSSFESTHLLSRSHSLHPFFLLPSPAWGSLPCLQQSRSESTPARVESARSWFSLARDRGEFSLFCIFLFFFSFRRPLASWPQTSKTSFLRRERALTIVLSRSRTLIAFITDLKAPPKRQFFRSESPRRIDRNSFFCPASPLLLRNQPFFSTSFSPSAAR